MSQFENGQSVRSITLSCDSGEDGAYFVVGFYTVLGKEITDIKVVMENGQMAPVPWFEVWLNGKPASKWNGAMLEGVELL